MRFFTRITASLFIVQLIHLYWLSTDVVIFRLTGKDFFELSDFWSMVIALVDYTEVPALIAGTVLYLKNRNLLFLVLINLQWLHLFWITDEFIVEQFTGAANTVLPLWLAWLAIVIDYLELPVIFDTIRKSVKT